MSEIKILKKMGVKILQSKDSISISKSINLKISEDEKLRKTIGQKGKTKYMKYFNSTLVADFIINKTYEINRQKKYLWHKP